MGQIGKAGIFLSFCKAHQRSDWDCAGGLADKIEQLGTTRANESMALGGHNTKAIAREEKSSGHAPDSGNDINSPVPQSVLRVQALSAAAQDAQVTRWAAMEDEAKLDKVLAGHNAEVKPRVKDVQTTRQVLAIQNVSVFLIETYCFLSLLGDE